MGLFSKSVTDEDWVSQVMPLYQSVLHSMTSLNEAVANNSVDEEATAFMEAIQNNLPVIAEEIRQLPSPSSPKARQAKKSLDSAMKNYIEGMKRGATFFQSVTGGPGERLQMGGIVRRAAAGRIAFEKSVFETFIEDAGKSLKKASPYFSTMID